MASLKLSNYQARIFIPIVVLIWGFVIFLSFFHYYRSVNYKRSILKANIDLITNRVVESFESDDMVAANKFLGWIDTYYTTTDLDDVSVAVFDTQNETKVASAGFQLPMPNISELKRRGEFSTSDIDVLNEDGTPIDLGDRELFYYRTRSTADGKYLVQTVMPLTAMSAQSIAYSPVFIITIVIVAIVLTFIIYFFTAHLAKNITALRDFVDHAVAEKDTIPVEDFSNDELGDISRKIVELHIERVKAMNTLEHEHQIALKVTEEKSQMKRQLTDNINHELKTPIGIVKGYIDTLLENPDIDADTRNHFLSKSAIQINRLSTMLNDISTITRLEESASTIPTEKIDFQEVVFTTANDIVESGINKNMEFVYDIPFDTFIRGNFNLLGSVISNLAKNAANYSEGTEMGVKLINKNKNFYTFSFYDNGKGVDPTHLPHLFDRFYRVDSGRSRKNGGTGLGLPIVKSSILTLGGTISVRNRKGGGLEYLFTLPVWHD
ncbi:MAG: HAMP domain-containing histidine kinase [Muribaculaceae bacterium]|nr:HAMP domain-containing histidine kinase [Muribaculaceae bacterium]MDE7368848.1 HAMP domain-containing histidine kinase [Muribaculaceae bacterium]